MTDRFSNPDPQPPIEARPITQPRETPPWPSAPWPPRPPRRPSPLATLELPGLSRKQAWLDLMLVFLATILMPYLPLFFALLTPSLEFESNVSAMVIAQTWCQALLAAGLLFYLIMRHRLTSSSFGVRSDRLGEQFAWSLGALMGVYAALLVSVYLVGVIIALYPETGTDLEKRIEFAEQLPAKNIGTTVVLLIAVAVNEEVIFRGLLLPYLRRITGRWIWAGLISTLLFASLHIPNQGLLGGIQIIAIGAVLSIFFLLSRSLLAVIVAHFCFDLIQFQLLRFLPRLKELLDKMPVLN